VHTSADGPSASTPSSDHRDPAVVFVAAERRCVGGNELADLGDDGLEDFARRSAFRNERRDAPQRSLLLGEPPELLARLTPRDGRCHQRRELAEALLDLIGKGCVPARHRNDAPHPTVDDDRCTRSGAHPRCTSTGGDLALVARVARDRRGSTGAQHARRHRRAVERPARPRLKGVRLVAPGGEHGHGHAVVVVATDDDERDLHDFSDLSCDGRVRVGRRCAPRDEGGYPSKCGLFVRESGAIVASRVDVCKATRHATSIAAWREAAHCR
jgi:hypothetical protein